MKTADQGYQKEHMARAVGRSLPISFKSSIEICNRIRKLPLAKAKTMLRKTIALQEPIKFTRFTNGLGHRRGNMGSGRYPQKAATHILAILESAEANAQFKGLNTGTLVIRHIVAQNAGNSWRYGRQRRRKMKRTNLEVIVAEGEIKAKRIVKKAPATKVEAKPAEVKKETPAAAPKPAAEKQAEVKKEAPKAAPAADKPKPTAQAAPAATKEAPKKASEAKKE